MSKYEGKLVRIDFNILKTDGEESYSISLQLKLSNEIDECETNSHIFGVTIYCDTSEEVISTYKEIFNVFDCNNTECITDGTEDVCFKFEDNTFTFTSLRTGKSYIKRK